MLIFRIKIPNKIFKFNTYKNKLKNNNVINKLFAINIKFRKFKVFFPISNTYKEKLK